jgi:hypothetical protein
MNTDPLRDLATHWREQAETWRQYVRTAKREWSRVREV